MTRKEGRYTPEDVRAAINTLRIQRGITIEQMAMRCGINRWSLQTMLYRNSGPSVDMICAVVGGSEISFEEFGRVVDEMRRLRVES